MKNHIYIFFILIGFSHSQTYQIGIGGGSTFVVGQDFYKDKMESVAFQDYLGSPYTVINTSGLNFGSEYNFSIKFRLSFNKLPFNFVSELNYNSIVGNGSIRIVPSPASSFLPPPQKAESSCTLINLSLGSEYRLPDYGFTPLLSGNILINYFDDIEIRPIEVPFSSNKFKVGDGGFRYGFEIGIGIDFGFSKNLSINISSKYAMTNLVARKSSEKQLNILKTNINFMYKFGNSI